MIYGLLLVLVGIIGYLAFAAGSDKNEKARLKDVIRGQALSNKKFASVMDKVTKEKFNFYEQAQNARTANDFVQLYNKLLEVDPEHITIPDRTPTKPAL